MDWKGGGFFLKEKEEEKTCSLKYPEARKPTRNSVIFQ
jgi:hypothetical protein